MPTHRSAIVERLRRRLYGGDVSRFRSLAEAKVGAARDVLIFGPGRGLNEPDWRAAGRHVVGVDVDEAVYANRALDQARRYDGLHLPFDSASFDLCLARWVIEHLPDPAASFGEIFRVLRPGGSFIFLTSNRWYYPFLVARLIPNRWHAATLGWIGVRDGIDTFPTFYRANSRRIIRRLLTEVGFREELLELELSGADYLEFSTLAYLLGVAYERIVNATSLLADGRQALVGSYVRPARNPG